ncbi:hypothetical protein OS493_039990 [Desmophyllum pertusum]|uniref:Uncharacterized protein n=1 Tax=Desmophyllum pertusum TaxID=174260 RepID=A0A9W9ZUG3_9CNID|nr:hypothetical protein OS493_039990 [Desmophyllum pertusum]
MCRHKTSYQRVPVKPYNRPENSRGNRAARRVRRPFTPQCKPMFPTWYKDMQKGVEVPVQTIEEPESYLCSKEAILCKCWGGEEISGTSILSSYHDECFSNLPRSEEIYKLSDSSNGRKKSTAQCDKSV